ncbi:hypothetical protein B9T39_06470 [Alloscardovia macacae]|uniref:Uncharacterized protein n=2 Tax=Alloscardovia macacae TaxID=1160091 RepID=A0A1Y2SZ74_9BIFI|nr:hypothetical protein [Alloscardovia macacae]OTA28518.1 hypothetical protein B9T39_06470 [Alloscardovia macacae]
MSTAQSASETQRHILSQASSLYSFVRDVSQTVSSVLDETAVLHSYVLSTLPEDCEHIECSAPGQPFRLSVSKPHFSSPPAPDPCFVPWLVDPVPPYGDGSVQPTLVTGERALFEDFQDDPERVTAHRMWRRTHGKWHLETERYKRVQKLFDTLYTMLLTLRRSEDELELVLADGFVRLTSAPQMVYGPLVTHRLSLRHDVSINAFILEDAHQGLQFSPVSVPSAHLSPSERPSLFSERTSAWARTTLRTPELSSWNDTALTDFFELLTRHMPQNVQFLRSAEDSAHSSQRDYSLYRKPQLLLRKAMHTWDMRRKHAQAALENIQRTGSIQPALAALLTSPPVLDTPQSESTPPLLMNPTAEVLLSAMNSPVHLVETCPGSTRDQLIGQMLVRLMAEGKRVLVTSARQKTLRTLAAQIPQPLQTLVACEHVLPDVNASPHSSSTAVSDTTVPDTTVSDARSCISALQKYAREHTLSELSDTVQALQEKQTHLLDEL